MVSKKDISRDVKLRRRILMLEWDIPQMRDENLKAQRMLELKRCREEFEEIIKKEQEGHKESEVSKMPRGRKKKVEEPKEEEKIEEEEKTEESPEEEKTEDEEPKEEDEDKEQDEDKDW